LTVSGLSNSSIVNFGLDFPLDLFSLRQVLDLTPCLQGEVVRNDGWIRIVMGAGHC